MGFGEIINAVGMEMGNAFGFEASVEFYCNHFVEVWRPGGSFVLVGHVGPAGTVDIPGRSVTGVSAGS